MDQLKQGSGVTAGTLVHTDQGLVQIQDIKIGDMVLSRDESGELAYKRAIQLLVTENQIISGVIAAIELEENGGLKEEFLFTSADHLFFKLDTYNHDVGNWAYIYDFESGDFSKNFLDQDVCLVENLKLYQTTEAHKAFYMVYPDSDGGIFLNVDSYKYNLLKVPNYLADESLEVVNWDENEDPIADEYITTVYNLEVEDFHTYFVGELGVWVHNGTML